MPTVTTPLEKIKTDLAWRGPNDKPLGHVVLTRAEAETLLRQIRAISFQQAKAMAEAQFNDVYPRTWAPMQPDVASWVCEFAAALLVRHTHAFR